MTNFHILIKDNFFEKDLLHKLQINVMQLKFDAQSSGFFRKGKGLKHTNYDNKNHTWFSVPVEEDVEKIIEDKCIKLFNKKLKLNFCFYTILGKAHPMPHCDLKETCHYQAVIYIKGNKELNKGTGFYSKDESGLELNTHVGFNENRVTIWDSNTWHTPLNFASDDTTRRYSIICQFEKLR